LLSGLNDVAAPARWAVLGAVGLGVVGAVVGLVLGLFAYPATAWFAMFEVGVPSSFLGALIGFAAGSIAWCAGRSRRAPAPH
jgi:hypothetical protein